MNGNVLRVFEELNQNEAEQFYDSKEEVTQEKRK